MALFNGRRKKERKEIVKTFKVRRETTVRKNVVQIDDQNRKIPLKSWGESQLEILTGNGTNISLE